jgi:hypothetical protein
LGGRSGRSIVIVVIVILLLQVRILEAASVLPCPSKVVRNGVGAGRRSRPIFLTLNLEAFRPLLHDLLIGELDGKVLDAGIALPPDLHTM